MKQFIIINIFVEFSVLYMTLKGAIQKTREENINVRTDIKQVKWIIAFLYKSRLCINISSYAF